MKTFSAKPHEVQRDWFVVDGTDKVLGRLASAIAHRLRGKHKAIYTPHVDTGDFIVVVNVEKIKVTGNKALDKKYYRHSGYPGGITETRRIADLADSFHVAYAPHVGWSGALCAAASVQLAAAQPNFLVYECMIFDNPLREALLARRVGSFQDLADGHVAVPQGPGLGVEVDRDALARFTIR